MQKPRANPIVVTESSRTADSDTSRLSLSKEKRSEREKLEKLIISTQLPQIPELMRKFTEKQLDVMRLHSARYDELKKVADVNFHFFPWFWRLHIHLKHQLRMQNVTLQMEQYNFFRQFTQSQTSMPDPGPTSTFL